MQKTLDVISLLLKILTTSLGVLGAADLTALHLTAPLLGTIVGGLGTASIVVKALQSNQPPAA